MGRAKYVLVPFVAPIALVWIFVGIYALLGPALLIALGLRAVGEPSKGDAVLDFAIDLLSFEGAVWRRILRGR